MRGEGPFEALGGQERCGIIGREFFRRDGSVASVKLLAFWFWQRKGPR
jgi:hypothetical protein